MTTILVCGGREYADMDRVTQALDLVHESTPVTRLIHGGARGADTLGKNWAQGRGIDEKGYPADWADIDVPGAKIRFHADDTPYNAAAGTQRNQQMLDEEDIDLVVAFPGGRGTDDMRGRALKSGVAVLDIDA